MYLQDRLTEQRALTEKHALMEQHRAPYEEVARPPLRSGDTPALSLWHD